MVSTTSNSKENRVTVTNNAAKYYSEQSQTYANQAKSYADIAKETESEIAQLLEDETFTLIQQNIDDIKTVADNINNLGTAQIEWGEIAGDLLDQTDLVLALNSKIDEFSLANVAASGSYNDLNDLPNIPIKVSELVNDSGYLTSVPTGYVTETELNAKGFLTTHQDISGKQDCLTTEQLSAIANVTNKANISDVYTKTEIDTKLGNIETLLEGV